MNKTVLTVILSLVAGIAIGAWSTSDSQPDTGTGIAASDHFDAGAPDAERLAALERIVAEERQARLVIEEQLHALLADFDRIDTAALQELLRQMARSRNQMQQVEEEQAATREARRVMRNYSDMRIARLVNGGFTEARANQIRQLEDEARMEVLQAEYEAQLDGTALTPWDQAMNYQATMRDRLGDAEFANYLQAQGGQSSITVRDVIGSSPASRAGLQPGDQIVGYDGERVFSMYELKSRSFGGNPGEDVVVDIERDGQRMQLVLPRGPMGITGSGAGMNYRYGFGG
jgi:predicted metalloprotease with PDZ domain